MSKVVVVGAGQAGAAAVAKLRNSGFDGQITMIGAEKALPYQRPPLSKKYMLGEIELERLFLRPQSFYDDNNIILQLGSHVTKIDRDARTVITDAGSLSYDNLILATGSWPRRLPPAIGGDLRGVYVMRDLSDADAMAAEFQKDRHVLIIGGGYIGLEAAAVAAQKGLRVTLVEMADRILQRVAAPQTSDYFRELHQKHGVAIKEGVGLDRLTGTDGQVSGARLTDGTELDIDFAIVGVGIVPATELAEAAGLEIDNGIKTNTFGQTSDPYIWAAGDCASFPHDGAMMRLESVPNAIDQAEVVAQNILGAQMAYTPKPWFWSDQYDIKLQIAGLNAGYDTVVTRKDREATSFWYYNGDALLAVDAMNDPKSFMIGKRLIEAGKTADKSNVADPNFILKDLLKA